MHGVTYRVYFHLGNTGGYFNYTIARMFTKMNFTVVFTICYSLQYIRAVSYTHLTLPTIYSV